MYYSEDFKAKVKQIYPEDFYNLYSMLNNGNTFVGRILDDNSNDHVTNEEILTLSKSELRKLAKQYKAKRDIYEEWCELYQNNQKELTL